MRAKTTSSARREYAPRTLSRELPLRNHAERALSDYFASLNGHRPADLYELVLREVEEPLFRARDTSADVFEFRRAAVDGPMLLTISDASGWKSDCRPVALAQPSAEKLEEYVGVFFNDELLVEYRFVVRDGNLHLQVNNHGWERLDPTTIDRFVPHARSIDDNRIIQFSRGDSGHVDSAAIDLWRVQGVRLQKTN